MKKPTEIVLEIKNSINQIKLSEESNRLDHIVNRIKQRMDYSANINNKLKKEREMKSA